MKLLKSEIRYHCGDSAYQRSIELHLKHRIVEMDADVTDKAVILTGSVAGTARVPYSCRIVLRDEADGALHIQTAECSCPAAAKWYGMCKHCGALCLSFSDQLKQQQRLSSAAPSHSARKTDSALLDVLQRYSARSGNELSVAPGSLRIAVEFFMNLDYSRMTRYLSVQVKAGADRMYIVKSIPEFVHSVLHGTQYAYGKKLSVQHSMELFDADSQRILQLLIDVVREARPDIDSRPVYCPDYQADRYVALNRRHTAALLQACAQRSDTVLLDERECRLIEGDPTVTLAVRPSGKGAELVVSTLDVIGAEPRDICILGGNIYFCSEEFAKKVLPLLYGMGAITSAAPFAGSFLSEEDFGRFAAYVLPAVRDVISVDEGGMDFTPYLPRIPEFRFYLSGIADGGVRIRAEACYGENAYPLETTGNEYRNARLEKPVAEAVANYFPEKLSDETRDATGEDAVYRVLSEGLDRLREFGSVFVDDSLRSLRFAPSPTVNVGVALHGNLIDLQVDSEGYSPGEINDILGAYRVRKKYYRLRSGEFLSLTEGGLSVVAELADGIDLRFDENGHARAPAFRAPYISAVLDSDDSGVDLHRNAAFRSQVLALKNYRDDGLEIPSTLQATLRGYQKSGYRWLSALSSCGLGGILADDMGLGKTVQMLAYFLHLGGSFLVVCPASLLYNWESECRRFAPTIPCHIMRGTEVERKDVLQHTEGLTITSYDQLRRDIDLYKDRHFDCCVLDEAQFIRNAGTKAAKAVKQICADHRFALTGTPIENRLSDLWSIFDFLMPGYLFRYPEFKSRIEQAVINGEETAKDRLARLTGPFVLRRKKADVLKELPDKQETVVYVEMTEEQRKLYNAQEQALRLTLQKTSEADYLHQKIEYLAALTRLRQICCTPELYLQNYSGGSGKIDACMELLTNDAESGHRTLVFSQFTGMLELLIARAESCGLRYLYLSGKNTVEQRRDMVQKFQKGEYAVFFISLKAGGTGLNLTAADRVLHFDPWWNVAAEEQAADRAHRIGQKNKVLVTKLVCKDTIEERILDLQERKRTLSDVVMNRDGISSAALDRDALLQLLQSEQA